MMNGLGYNVITINWVFSIIVLLLLIIILTRQKIESMTGKNSYYTGGSYLPFMTEMSDTARESNAYVEKELSYQWNPVNYYEQDIHLALSGKNNFEDPLNK